MYQRADSESSCCIFFQWSIRCLSRPPKPLSYCSIVESCIFPVLLYGSENWVLNSSLLQELEYFQAEFGRHVLKLPKFSSNTAPLLVLNWPTMCARVLCNKLSFLICVCRGKSTSLSTQVFRSIAVSDVTSMSIVKQCHFLDSILDTQFTNDVLNNSELSSRDLKKRIIEADRLKIMEKSENRPSLFHIFCIARENKWLKFWDVALEYGYNGSKALLAILKSLCLTVFSDRHCPMQNCTYIVPQGVPLCQHFFECHTEFDSSVITDCILSSTSNSDQFMSLIPLGLSLLKVLPF